MLSGQQPLLHLPRSDRTGAGSRARITSLLCQTSAFSKKRPTEEFCESSVQRFCGHPLPHTPETVMPSLPTSRPNLGWGLPGRSRPHPAGSLHSPPAGDPQSPAKHTTIGNPVLPGLTQKKCACIYLGFRPEAGPKILESKGCACA